MSYKILVTGGAGFIGSHLVDALIEKGHQVRIFDNLDPQVHGPQQGVPEYLNPEAEFIRGDMKDRQAVLRAIEGCEIIFHEAAAVGVGQSMYEIQHYIEANTLGTAILWDILVNESHSVKKVLVASSMSNYGEGEYQCNHCGVIYPKLRPQTQLKEKAWEMQCSECQGIVEAIPTSEAKPLYPTSVYAISKKDQEELSLVVGRTYNIPTVALRYFNVYGPRQALSNPYTGVAAIFSSRILNGHSPVIFEDGLQSRDFIHVSDIVAANLLAMESEEADFEVLNVGTGRRLTILDMADILLKDLKRTDLKPEITSQFREGDIRHCYADITKIQKLGFKPNVPFEEGVAHLTEWVKRQTAIDIFEHARNELNRKGLVK
ncbi:MAG: NAD-dependent epimerase/dehydratase family protein [bacterium]|nr:NAD-dependent epimerase/dehydratase family protein [bacterium]